MTEPAVLDHGGAVGSSGPRGASTSADAPDERSRADAGALGQGAAQPVHSALFKHVLQVPGAGYEHAERIDGRPSDADNGLDAPDDVWRRHGAVAQDAPQLPQQHGFFGSHTHAPRSSCTPRCRPTSPRARRACAREVPTRRTSRGASRGSKRRPRTASSEQQQQLAQFFFSDRRRRAAPTRRAAARRARSRARAGARERAPRAPAPPQPVAKVGRGRGATAAGTGRQKLADA